MIPPRPATKGDVVFLERQYSRVLAMRRLSHIRALFSNVDPFRSTPCRALGMQAVSASKASRVVIVIDDEPDNVELTVMVLQAAGHDAYGATDGASGIGLAIDHAADVVVLDYFMPSMNGDRVGHALRADPRTRDIKIVMCSGTPQDAVRSQFSGYDAFLTKPLNGADLLSLIDAV